MVIAAVACVPIIALFYFGLHTDPREIESRMPGKPAPDFSLTNMADSSTVTLASMRGHYVVINFWASWCAPCRVEHNELVQTATAYSPRGVKFVGVLDGDTPSGALRYFEQMGAVPYPTLLQTTSHTGIDYGLNGVPETFIVDPHGNIRYALKGAWGVPLKEGDAPPNLAMVLDSLMAVDKVAQK
jgi:cytochrome c biogenesis protein CcmG/thiol:disulfide interchange protein DsbE